MLLRVVEMRLGQIWLDALFRDAGGRRCARRGQFIFIFIVVFVIIQPLYGMCAENVTAADFMVAAWWQLLAFAIFR